MAIIQLRDPIDRIQGKFSSSDEIYFRRYGKDLVGVRMKNPRTEFSDHEKEIRSNFGALSKQASQIAKNPELAAPYMAAYKAQKRTGIASLYRYILAQLTKASHENQNSSQGEQNASAGDQNT